jgi:chromosome partitioning protein
MDTGADKPEVTIRPAITLSLAKPSRHAVWIAVPSSWQGVMTEQLVILCIANFKGGSGKTTTAIHIAAFMATLAPTILADGDIVRASSKWAQRGGETGLPFKVVPIGQLAKHVRQYEHVVIDTEANPSDEDFKDAAQGCDLLIIPAEPETTATDGLTYTLSKLREIKHERYRVLLTKVPPPPQTEGMQLRMSLKHAGIPIFKAEIPLLVAYRKASAEGITAREVRGDANARRAWLAYERVGKEIING